ncbi:MAG: hypothetical protein KatS3mg014_0557 [Actinomycetota bacterium]|nr:MAG: hypothetical protein KatS3mg014_0557 [Actinomycetota bacterium]
MPKYLWKVSYTVEGLRGLLKQGAQDRAAQIAQITASNGGTVESFNFAFGDTDVYVIADLPGDTTAAAISMAVAASGTARVETVKLLTPAEVDEARGIQTGYVPPGA